MRSGVTKLRQTIELLGVLQIDSLNVLVHARYLPAVFAPGLVRLRPSRRGSIGKVEALFRILGTRGVAFAYRLSVPVALARGPRTSRQRRLARTRPLRRLGVSS